MEKKANAVVFPDGKETIVRSLVQPTLGASLALNGAPVCTTELAVLTTANVGVTTVGWVHNATKVSLLFSHIFYISPFLHDDY